MTEYLPLLAAWVVATFGTGAWLLWMMRQTIVSVRDGVDWARPYVVNVVCRRRLLELRRMRTLVKWVDNVGGSGFFWADSGVEADSPAARAAISAFGLDKEARRRADRFTGDLKAEGDKLMEMIEGKPDAMTLDAIIERGKPRMARVRVVGDDISALDFLRLNPPHPNEGPDDKRRRLETAKHFNQRNRR